MTKRRTPSRFHSCCSRWPPHGAIVGRLPRCSPPRVFLTSWPGLIGLAFPLAGIAVARWRDFGAVRALTRVAGLAGTAYGLAAFWMTPAYFVSSRMYNRVVFRHTMLTAPWNRTTWLILAAALLVLALSFWRRVPSELALPAVWTALSGLVVLGYLIAGNYLLPLPHRYLLELSAGLARFSRPCYRSRPLPPAPSRQWC